MQQNWAEFRTQLTRALPAARPYLPLFYVWGILWIFQAVFGLLDNGSFPAWMPFASIAAAVGLSLVIILTTGKSKQNVQLNWTSIRWLALPYLLFAVIAVALFYLEAVGRYFFPLFQGLVLSLFYLKLGILIRRIYLYLGLWLMMLSLVTPWAYLGFLPFVISFMGGCSLIVCGWLLSIDCRADKERT